MLKAHNHKKTNWKINVGWFASYRRDTKRQSILMLYLASVTVQIKPKKTEHMVYLNTCTYASFIKRLEWTLNHVSCLFNARTFGLRNFWEPTDGERNITDIAISFLSTEPRMMEQNRWYNTSTSVSKELENSYDWRESDIHHNNCRGKKEFVSRLPAS